MTVSLNSESAGQSSAVAQLLEKFKHIAKFSQFLEKVQNLETDFDWQFYLAYYEDLQNLSTAQQAYEHWALFGQFEGRFARLSSLELYLEQHQADLPEDFDAEGYVVLNPDLRPIFSGNPYRGQKIAEHFLQCGRAEGRLYQSNFDWQFYIAFNHDLEGLTTYEAAYDHWLTVGRGEQRFVCEADLLDWIEQKQPDLPTDFNCQTYLDLNRDLQANFSSIEYGHYWATIHFLRYGHTENRPYRVPRLALDILKQSSHAALHSALFSEFQDQPDQAQTDRAELAVTPLLDYIQGRITETDRLAQIADQTPHIIHEALAFYRSALQLQPNTFDVISRLQTLYKSSANTESIWKSPCGKYECIEPVYGQWLRENTPDHSDLSRFSDQVADFDYLPLISVILPVYNTPETFLREAIQSVINQVYPYWELCIADDQSTQPHVQSVLEEYATQDSRIKLLFRSTNGHISACSNTALTVATGEFIALLDHDDVIVPEALYEVVSLLNQHPEADMIYSDEDKLNERGQLLNPYFKPDWCPDAFLSRMYTCHLGVYRRSLVSKIGGFRVGYEGSQDYDLVLRLTEQTKRIFHLPKMLYHWRMHAESTSSSATAKPYAYKAAIAAITSALQRRDEPGEVCKHPIFTGLHTIRYQIKKPALVSIIIPTKNLSHVLARCLESIFTKSSYSNYEIIVIDNGSDELALEKLLSSCQRRYPQNFRVYTLDIPFNFSRINNYAVTKAKGDYLLFLNNDTEVITPDWIEGLVEQAQRSTIGAVGPLLLYPDNSVQHAGIVLGIQGQANHGHRHFSAQEPGYFGHLATLNNCAAVTGACLMCRRQVFEQVGGFNEKLAVAYNDVDLCLKMLSAGYRNIYLPHVKLYHHESRSRGYEDSTEKQARLQAEAILLQNQWQSYIDPHYSPHLTRDSEDYSIRVMDTKFIKILEVNYPAIESGLLWDFAIDELLVGKIYRNFVLLRGWVLGKCSFAVGLEVISNGQVIQFIPINEQRLDLVPHYPNLPRVENCGFLGKLSLDAVPDVPDAALEYSLQTVLADGTRIILCHLSVELVENLENQERAIKES
jgi:glycosyltransferase involved in cell wall biosynthesis